jgi:hypothetical protein
MSHEFHINYMHCLLHIKLFIPKRKRETGKRQLFYSIRNQKEKKQNLDNITHCLKSPDFSKIYDRSKETGRVTNTEEKSSEQKVVPSDSRC